MPCFSNTVSPLNKWPSATLHPVIGIATAVVRALVESFTCQHVTQASKNKVNLKAKLVFSNSSTHTGVLGGETRDQMQTLICIPIPIQNAPHDLLRALWP